MLRPVFGARLRGFSRQVLEEIPFFLVRHQAACMGDAGRARTALERLRGTCSCGGERSVSLARQKWNVVTALFLDIPLQINSWRKMHSCMVDCAVLRFLRKMIWVVCAVDERKSCQFALA